MADHPIKPRVDAKPHVAEVIDLDGVRIQWGLPETRYNERCGHTSLVYSQEERRVWCEDCNRTIENFEAFMVFVHNFQRIEQAASYKMAKADAAMKATIHRRATKAIDKAWSGRVGAISCPHCKGGLLPEDYADGIPSWTSREIELARRESERARGPQ